MTSSGPEGAEGRRAAAGAWRARLALGEVGAESGLAKWLAEHPDNASAWTEADRAWAVFDRVDSHPAADAAVQEALGRARARRSRRRAQGWAAAAAAVAVVAWSAWSLAPGSDTYRTGLGERRIITLADGSRVTLDADTLLKVKFKGDARTLDLVRGQASFDVAHDRTRPFAVRARGHRVIALGTRFDVDVLGSTVRVTLLEGRVRVAPEPAVFELGQGGPHEVPVDLRRGEQAVLRGEATRAEVVAADIPKATAWQAGQLVFDEEPLAAVLARINRYSRVKLEVNDPGLASRRISGVFRAGDVTTFLDAAQHLLSVQAVDLGGDRVELRPTTG